MSTPIGPLLAIHARIMAANNMLRAAKVEVAQIQLDDGAPSMSWAIHKTLEQTGDALNLIEEVVERASRPSRAIPITDSPAAIEQPKEAVAPL